MLNNNAKKNIKWYNNVFDFITIQVSEVTRKVEDANLKYQQLDEEMPLELHEKIDEMETLKESIQNKFKEQENALIDAREKRMRFQAIQQEVTQWVRQAEAQLKDDYDGVKYEQAEQQLEEHKVCYTTVDVFMEHIYLFQFIYLLCHVFLGINAFAFFPCSYSIRLAIA